MGHERNNSDAENIKARKKGPRTDTWHYDKQDEHVEMRTANLTEQGRNKPKKGMLDGRSHPHDGTSR